MTDCNQSCSSPLLDVARLQASEQALNQECFCISLDRERLRHALEHELEQPALIELLEQRNPFVFSGHPVFVSQQQLHNMQQLVEAVEQVVALPAWREQALQRAPAIARHTVGQVRGVFYGYDFHVTHDRLGLIEINTNAGGAMLNTLLMRAQRACCEPLQQALPGTGHASAIEQQLVQMFREEWAAGALPRPLRTLVIVDENPPGQYLYAEFLLFARLLRAHGLQVFIADPSELEWRDGQLWLAGQVVDLVYNRLTDFYLEQPASAALRAAWLASAVVVTPNPHGHALYADKHNLVWLSQPEHLQQLGVPQDVQQVLLRSIPATRPVRASEADYWWSVRRQHFFKPATGYGSRAAWRGDKLTRRVFEEILAGDYVAQALMSPGERSTREQTLKFDLRQYVYAGQVQLTAARLYQGQTTNFRTPGGGFAPVYGLPARGSCCSPAAALAGAAAPDAGV